MGMAQERISLRATVLKNGEGLEVPQLILWTLCRRVPKFRGPEEEVLIEREGILGGGSQNVGTVILR